MRGDFRTEVRHGGCVGKGGGFHIYASGVRAGFGDIYGGVCGAACAPWLRVESTIVPTTVMVQTAARPIRAAQVLSGDDAEYFTARAEKGAYGPMPVWALARDYNIYTYDSQKITSSQNGSSGYRYRMLWQQGEFSPVVP